MGFLVNLYWRCLRNPRYGWLVFLGGLIYLISPLDILPDIFPLVGQVDDLLLITLMVSGFMQNVATLLKPPTENSAQSSNQESIKTIDVDATTL